jgi:hypothetical protein
MERRALIIAQRPQTCVLGCSDSRVPVEIVFDQGLGDMFVIRGAGNVADTSTLASVEYAVQHLRVKVCEKPAAPFMLLRTVREQLGIVDCGSHQVSKHGPR